MRDRHQLCACDSVDINLSPLLPSANPRGDGVVDGIDRVAILGAWGSCPPPPVNCRAETGESGAIDVLNLWFLPLISGRGTNGSLDVMAGESRMSRSRTCRAFLGGLCSSRAVSYTHLRAHET